MKRAVALLIAVLLLSSKVYAESNFEPLARELNELSLFKGTTSGFELERAPTRAECGVMLIRLLGKEEEALKSNYTHPFKDVPFWVDPYVGFLYEHGLTKGTSATTFSANDLMNVDAYTTFVLRSLGYDDTKGDFLWNSALSDSSKLGLVSEEDLSLFQGVDFTRGHMVSLSHRALSTQIKNTKDILIDRLIADGAVSVVTAGNLGLVSLLEIGDFVFYGKYNNEPIIWQVINLDEYGNPMLFSYNGLMVKPFDVPSFENKDTGILYGSNLWESSTLRKWLNSRETIVNWGEKAPIAEKFDEFVLGYDKEPGFLSSNNFTFGEFSGILKVNNKVLLPQYATTSSMGGYENHIASDDYNNLKQNYDNAYYTYTEDRVFLLSIQEVSDYVLKRGYNSLSNLTRTTQSLYGSSAKGFWLRDPEMTSYHVVRMLYDSRRVTMEGAKEGSVAVRPAIYVDRKLVQVLSGSGKIDEPFKLSLK